MNFNNSQYDYDGKGTERSKRGIYEHDHNIYETAFSVKITMEGLISLLLVQLPGIALGVLGIIKSLNHGCSMQTFKDSLR